MCVYITKCRLLFYLYRLGVRIKINSVENYSEESLYGQEIQYRRHNISVIRKGIEKTFSFVEEQNIKYIPNDIYVVFLLILIDYNSYEPDFSVYFRDRFGATDKTYRQIVNDFLRLKSNKDGLDELFTEREIRKMNWIIT